MKCFILSGKRVVGEDGINDAWHENQMLTSELQSLRTRVKALTETVEALTAKNALLLAEKAAGQWVASGGGDVTSLVQGYLQEIEELRARLLEAEAMYQQLKKRQIHVSKQKLFKSKEYKLRSLLTDIVFLSQVNTSNPYSESSYVIHSDSSSILNDAKRELQKEIDLLAALKEQQTLNSTISSKEGEDGDNDDTENGQESMSEDESDDDSDRKGTF